MISVQALLAYTLALIFLGRSYWITQFSTLSLKAAQVFLHELVQESAGCQGLAVPLHPPPLSSFRGILPPGESAWSCPHSSEQTEVLG